MCTVSVIALGNGQAMDGLRLVINRDESDSRPKARPPEWRTVQGVRAVWPTDPAGGGTWVAGTEQGLVLAVLNRNIEPRPALPQHLSSRGLIIPSLAHAPGVRRAVALLRSMDVERFAPFRLVVSAVQDGVVHAAVCTWDRRDLVTEDALVPLCLASSGLGDSLVQVRLPLFDVLVRPQVSPESQDAFHAHAWEDAREKSVLMRRAGYRTVSVTSVEVRAGRVAMDYHDV